MFSLYYALFIVILVISLFGLEGGTLVLIASVPGYCLSFSFCDNLKNTHHSVNKVNTVGELMLGFPLSSLMNAAW